MMTLARASCILQIHLDFAFFFNVVSCSENNSMQQFKFRFQKVVYIAPFLVYLSDGITQDDDVQLLYFLPAMEFRPLGIPAELCSYAVVNSNGRFFCNTDIADDV